MFGAISPISRSDAAPPRVIIVGAGFGGLWAAKTLANAPVEVIVIDRENYHLFQPLLYQVATAGLSPADIAAPIRGIVGAYQNVTVILGEIVGVDVAARAVSIMGGRHVPYDYLVLATGARHAYFGHDDWEPLAPGLKRIEDATEIRRRILLAFERAENETDADERRRLMNLVIVGGGPTGVELAGAIAELARRALAKDFRNIDPRVTRIILVEAGPRLLPSFPEDLSDDATRRLEQLGVEIRLGAPVTAIDPSGVEIGTARIEARTVIWAAGVGASPAGHWIGAKCDRVGRIEVNPDLAVPGHPEIFAIGAREWLAIGVEGQRSVDLRGLVAWVIWTVAHIYFLIGFRNRTIVALNWLWAYFTFQRGARLGVDSERERLAALSNGTITRSLPLRRAAAVGSN